MKIKNVKVYGLSESMLRSGYPMQTEEPIDFPDDFELQEVVNLNNDIIRAEKLAKVPSGSGHDNWLKGVIVQFDIKYPQYWTQQFQRYNFQDIISSQSKMHRLTKVKDIKEHCNEYVLDDIVNIINNLILTYNNDNFPWTQSQFSSEDFTIQDKKECFYYIISNLPSGYELWMGVTLNYLTLKTMYSQRKNHKLTKEWGYFCNWIKTLPMSELITGKE